MFTYVYCSIIHNDKKTEAAQLSTDKWMDEQYAMCLYYAILISLKKEGYTDICDNMDGPWTH